MENGSLIAVLERKLRMGEEINNGDIAGGLLEVYRITREIQSLIQEYIGDSKIVCPQESRAPEEEVDEDEEPKGVRYRWDRRRKNLVLRAFKRHIDRSRFPRKEDINKFIDKHNDNFSGEDFLKIRTLVVNTYAFKKK